MNAPVLRLNAANSRKVIAAARLLDSDKPGEVLASARGMGRIILASLGNSDDRNWQELAGYCACRRRELDARDWLFVCDMAFAKKNLRATPEQENRLRSIATRLEAGEI